jgi:NADH-quinone oxidoreductase subunit M
MFNEIINVIYGMLPIYSLGLGILCWFIYSIGSYKVLHVLGLTALVTNLGTSTSLNRTALLWFSARVSSIRLVTSRVALYLSLLGQTVFLFLTLLCWNYLGSTVPEGESSVVVAPLKIEVSSESCGGAVIMDHFSCSLVALTAFVFLVSFGLLSKEVHRNLSFWCGLLFFLQALLITAFVTANLLLFYVSFEATLLPMYLLIGSWGARSRKIKANYYFFLYTLIGSFLTLLGLILLYCATGTFSYYALFSVLRGSVEPLGILSTRFEYLIWLLLSIGFLVKLPAFICHLWLPEAHVEAPTVGSIILAALLLKLGLYGLIRISITLFPQGTVFWLPWFLPLALIGTFYPAAIAVVQDDIKRIIAYSSVSHMSLALLGLMTLTVEGVTGAMFLAIGHGVTSGGLFALVGLLYDRYRTRDVKYFGGLVGTMPLFSIFFIIVVLGNVGFPFLCNFPGELLVLIGSVKRLGLLTFFLGLGFFVTAIYSFRLVNMILFGVAKPHFIRNRYDLTREECSVLFAFSAATILLGVLCAPLVGAFARIAALIVSVYDFL